MTHAEQFDLAVKRRIFAIVQRTHDIVSGGKRIIAVELTPRQTDEMRRIQPRVLGVDRDEHLHDVIFRQPVEDDRRNRELFALDVFDVGVEGEQTVLAVDGAEDAFALRHLQPSDGGSRLDRLERQLFVA